MTPPYLILLLHSLQWFYCYSLHLILLLHTLHDSTYPISMILVKHSLHDSTATHFTWSYCCIPCMIPPRPLHLIPLLHTLCGSAATHIPWSFCCTPHMILLQSTYSTWSYYCIFYISSVIYSTYLTFMLPALHDLALHVYLLLSILQYSTWFCCKPFYIILLLPIPNIPAVITLHDPTAPYCKWC
jgi:hypothetical protein